MKSFFRTKPKTPAELVHQTRDLLIFADRAAALDIKDVKRDEKVSSLFFMVSFLASQSLFLNVYNFILSI